MAEAAHHMTSEKPEDCKSWAWYTLGIPAQKAEAEAEACKPGLRSLVSEKRTKQNKRHSPPHLRLLACKTETRAFSGQL